MSPASNHTRRLRFGLGTTFAVVILAAVGLYWPWRIHQATLARTDFQEARAMFEWDTISTADLCERSLKLYRAETAVPFADHAKAAAEHYGRIESIWNHAYGPSSEWLMGVANDKQLKEAEVQRAKIEAYYNDAARMAGVEVLPAIQ